MQQLLSDQGCEDVVVLGPVPNREPVGVFHAVSTRDGEAQARDGQRFYALNPLESQGGEAIVEVQFGDGVWMLATPPDLEMGTSASDGTKQAARPRLWGPSEPCTADVRDPVTTDP